MAFDPRPDTSCVLRPVLSPDGSRIAVERQTNVGVAQVVIAPADGTAAGLPVGPLYPFGDGRFDFSPDGSRILLTLVTGKSHFIDVATGDPETTEVAVPGVPSWQRLAP